MAKPAIVRLVPVFQNFWVARMTVWRSLLRRPGITRANWMSCKQRDGRLEL